MNPRPRRRARIGIFLAAWAGTLLTGCPRGSGQQDLASLPSLTTADVAAEAELRAARTAAEAGDARDAEARYRRFLDEHPSDPLVPLAQLGLGRVLLANGAIEPALERFAIVASSDDERVAEAGRFYRGVALHLAGRHAESLELLTPLVGRTVDPEETSLLLRTLAASAEREGQVVVALGALDRLAGNADVSAEEREQARVDLRALVTEAAPEQVTRAYDELPREGVAWPEVAQRAIRLAFDAGDMTRVAAIVRELRERQIPMSDELAELALRAERTERADPRAIGAILPLSGRGREVGQRAMRGLVIASGAPAAGPAAPNASQLVLRDDGGDPERAARAVEDLVSVHRVIAIVGPLEGEAARAAARRAQELGVPIITLVPDPQVVGAGDMVFRLFASPREEASALVLAARARGASRFAVLRPSHGYGARMSAAFAEAVTAAGGELVHSETYDAGATSFGEPVRRLSAARFDALFIPDAAGKLALIAPALAAGGLWSAPAGGSAPRGARPITLLAPSVAADLSALQRSQRYLQGALFAAPFHAGTGASQAFTTAFRARFDEAPDVYAAHAYDAFRLAERAVGAGQTTRAGVAGWLRTQGRQETATATSGLGPDRGPARPSGVLELRGETLAPPQVGPSARLDATRSPASAERSGTLARRRGRAAPTGREVRGARPARVKATAAKSPPSAMQGSTVRHSGSIAP